MVDSRTNMQPEIGDAVERKQMKHSEKTAGTPIVSETDNKLQQSQEAQTVMHAKRFTGPLHVPFTIDMGDGTTVVDRRPINTDDSELKANPASGDGLMVAEEVARGDGKAVLTVSEAARELGGKVLSQPDAKGSVMDWENTQKKAHGHDRHHPYVDASQTLPGPPSYHTDEYKYYTNEQGIPVCERWHNNGGNGEMDNFVRTNATSTIRLPNGDRCNATVNFDLNGNAIGVDILVNRPTIPPSGYSVENVPPRRADELLNRIIRIENGTEHEHKATQA